MANIEAETCSCWYCWYFTYHLYIKLNVCLFVPCTNLHFWTDFNQTSHTSPPWSGRDSRVCMVRKCMTFLTFFVGNECRILGTKWLPAQVIRDSVTSVILAAVSVTLRKWPIRRQFRVLQESSATALYPLFLLLLVWRRGNDVVADDSFAFLLEVSCAMGNAYKTRVSERNACV